VLSANSIIRKLKRPAEAFFRCLATFVAQYPLRFSKLFRIGFFDAQPTNTLLLTPTGTESFVVSSSDHVIGRRLFASGQFEFENFNTILPLLGETFQRKCLIDIGANIGVISIPAVKRGFFEKAVAIEPEPLNYSLLIANIHINGLASRIEAINCAMGDGALSEMEMNLCEDNSGDHRIKSPNNSNDFAFSSRETIKVPCLTFDERIGIVDPNSTLIWMDTQGFEGFVLAGAKEALRAKPPLVVEFWPYGWEQSGCFAAFKQAIFDSHYRWFYDLSKPGVRQKVSFDAFDRLYGQLGVESQAFTDLLILA
jgi:FkbM family methyltransferase